MHCLIRMAFLLASLSAAAGEESRLQSIRLPRGFEISMFAEHVPGARSMALGEDGTVYLGTIDDAGKVYALRDRDGDGRAEQVWTVASGLNMPTGVAYHRGDLYVAEISRIVKFRDIAFRLDQPPPPEVIADVYPSERVHAWKVLRIGPDGKLYAPVGAPCNICRSDDPLFATMTRLDIDGKNLEIVAAGIRNTVGFDWHPITGDLYFTDNGADWLGDDKPPDELNRVTAPGQNFGYPYCHGADISDERYGDQQPCGNFVGPAWTFPPHVAPLGIRFYRGGMFPAEYRGQLFVAQHGSWNRRQPVGYRLVLVRFKDGKPISDEVFAEGWLPPEGKEWGRPVDMLELNDGSLLVSDDLVGAIYRIVYRSR